jgi:transcription termination factor NusB
MENTHEGNAEKAFRDLGKKIDALIEDLKESGEKAKEEFSDQWEGLRRSKESLEKEINEFREKHKDRIEGVEKSLTQAGQELKKAFKAAFGK